MTCFEKVTLAVLLRVEQGGQGQNRETEGYCRNTDKMAAETRTFYWGLVLATWRDAVSLTEMKGERDGADFGGLLRNQVWA